MSPLDMQIAFQDAFFRTGIPLEITSSEMFREMNEAQDDIVSQAYQRFEKDLIVTSTLMPLVVRNAELIPTVSTDSVIDGYTVDRITLPADFRYFISVAAKTEWVYGGYSGVTGTNPRSVDDVGKVIKVRGVRIVQQDDIDRVLQDPFSKPLYRSPVAVIHDSYIDFYTDNSSFVVSAGYLTYIKDPNVISLDGGAGGSAVPSELPEHAHRDIVDLAIANFLSRVSATARPEDNANKQSE